MSDQDYLRVLKDKDIGNMVSIRDVIAVIKDAMSRSNGGSTVWLTYEAVVEMMENISQRYDKELEEEIGNDPKSLIKFISLNDISKN